MTVRKSILPFFAITILFNLQPADTVQAGTVEVLNGNVLILNGNRHLLADILSPRPGDKCILRGRIIDCGRIAMSQLKDLTAGADIRCRRRGDGMSVCASNGYDLSEGMVYTGWAHALNDRLAATEAAAKAARRGMWRTSPLETVTEK